MEESAPFMSHRQASARLLAAASRHGTLDAIDKGRLREMRSRGRKLAAGEDVVRQGDRPIAAVLVVRGMLARYHTLPSGDRQYLAYHISGDMPDVQSLFLVVMDHSVCAMGQAEIDQFPLEPLRELCRQQPSISFAFWRSTLVDAAIFRQSISNNSARTHVARLAHFFCEQFHRARDAGLVQTSSCSLPISQFQLGQTLGMSLVSVNRALQVLRRGKMIEFRGGRLDVLDWSTLRSTADFDPMYLHIA